jgi:hypothetical protein
MSSRRAALTAVLLLIACDNPAAPRARDLRLPGRNADLDEVRTKGNVVFETDASLDNTCNGDVVTLQGKGHQVFSELDTGDTIYITVHTNFDDLKGYGVPSGARYHLNNTQTERDVVAVIPAFTFDASVRVSLELVSEGSEPNLIWDFTQAVRIDESGNVTITDVKNSLECRGSDP